MHLISRQPFALAALALFLIVSNSAHAQTAIRAQLIKSGFKAPVFVTSPPGDFKRLFVVEQRGSAGISNRADIRIMDLETREIYPQPFLTISPVATGGEEGLLGLAFHPNFANNKLFFTYNTNAAGNNILRSWRVSSSDPNRADPQSEALIMTLQHPVESNHNGGWIAFGPDGYLYVGTGDGGGHSDEHGNAQNLNSLLGKILRIDVDGAFPYSIPPDNPFVGTQYKQEILYWGLRNPWRNSFDKETGELFIGDVGQQRWEEINWRPAADSENVNFGWPIREGAHCYNSGAPCNPGYVITDPIHEFNHDAGDCSVTGGYVYRGCAIPGLRGSYFFGDYCSGNVWTFNYTNRIVQNLQNRKSGLGLDGIGNLVSFGQDNYGELYLVYQTGQIYKIMPAAGLTDCNENNVADDCEIAHGIVPDLDHNGIPDDCAQLSWVCGDTDGNKLITVSDAVFLIAYRYGVGTPPIPPECADADCSGTTNDVDVMHIVNYIFNDGHRPCFTCQ